MTERIILLGCLVLMCFMWISLANEIKRGKPFQLDKEGYEAHKVLVIKP